MAHGQPTSMQPTSAPHMSDGPLAGYRVLELGNWVAAPYAGSLLGDFGAEVFKVDLPGFIDDNRRLGKVEPSDAERSPYFVVLARNKKSVTLDIRVPAGRALFLKLVAKSDVVISNFRPGTLERYDLGFEVLKAANPHIVMLMISGYGQTGPLSQEPGLDRIAQSFAGVTYVTGHPDQPPVKCGLGIADYCGGMLGAFGVVIALLARATEEGSRPTAQVVDVALIDSLLAFMGDVPDRYHRSHEIRERSGNRYPLIAPGNSYRSKDGRWMLMSAAGEPLFARLAHGMGHPEWLQDPRYKTAKDRWEHVDELDGEVQAWFSQRSADAALAELSKAKIPVSIVNSIEDILASPQVGHRGSFTELPDPAFGSVLVPSAIPHMSRTPGGIRTTGPRPGEHNREVFDILDLDDGAIADLTAQKVV
jgi:crotonobetainyl-CoA:carnitine CoA-transferase CaiB-like acyl-CoA transferase